jgi:hypothetical protein
MGQRAILSGLLKGERVKIRAIDKRELNSTLIIAQTNMDELQICGTTK